jgi:hypothetical protein
MPVIRRFGRIDVVRCAAAAFGYFVRVAMRAGAGAFAELIPQPAAVAKA